MPADLEKLAYESALRALDKQERLVEELRARTGLVLAASCVAASLIGRPGGPDALALLAVGSFMVSVAASVFVLIPREDLMFSMSGTTFFQGLSDSGDAAETFLRAAATLDQVWATNAVTIQLLTQGFSVAAVALGIEVGALGAILGGIFI